MDRTLNPQGSQSRLLQTPAVVAYASRSLPARRCFASLAILPPPPTVHLPEAFSSITFTFYNTFKPPRSPRSSSLVQSHRSSCSLSSYVTSALGLLFQICQYVPLSARPMAPIPSARAASARPDSAGVETAMPSHRKSQVRWGARYSTRSRTRSGWSSPVSLD